VDKNDVPVMIFINSTQDYGNDKNTIELTTQGHLRLDDGNYFITYDEADELGKTKTIIRIEGENKLTLFRDNTNSAQLIIEKDKRHLSHYDTVNGDIFMGVFTNKFSSSMSKNGGELLCRYSLSVNQALISENEINIKVTPCS
jgi:uncharacterized beta-barrel protein YwiB (DUF1934 family)